jgi:hypothetical protein
MAEDLLERLRAVDFAVLTDIVRQDQNDLSFEISSWNVKRLSDKGIANPDGLWLFSGTGGHETHPWSIVLKILNRPSEEPTADHVWHWKREFSFAQSNLSKHLPGPVKAPRIYHTDETPAGCWIWMEYVQGIGPDPWTLDEYAFAAHQLGLWNGSYLTGTSLPSESWLTRQAYRSWLSGMDFDKDIQSPLHQKYLPKEILTCYKELSAERETFFKALENLPQVFSHFDSQRRNLFIRSGKTGQKELVLLDWGQCGVGAIGAELTWLIGLSVALLEWSPLEIARLDEITFPSYVRGLNESGWSGVAELVRLGFTSMFTVYIGCALPSLTAWWCDPEHSQFALQQFHHMEEELYLKWLPIFDHAIKYADEARILMKKLSFP